MKKSKIIALIICTILLACVLAGCEWYNKSEETQYTEDLKNQILDKYGFPDVEHFFEYTQLKEIYELRDDPNLICYWYTRNEYTGKWIFQGTCIGYGIPYGAAITAPESCQQGYAGGSYRNILPLSEPNGLYTDSVVTTATWILATDVNGEITPVYVETSITVSQTKLPANLCEDWSIPNNY